MKISIKVEECVEIVSDDFGSVRVTLNDKGEFEIIAIDAVVNNSELSTIKAVNSVVDVTTASDTINTPTESEEVIVINNEAQQTKENLALIQQMEGLANFEYVDLNPKKVNKTK